MKILKRDGRIKQFNIERIKTAIQKCYIEVLGEDEGLSCFKSNEIFIIPSIEIEIERLNKEQVSIEEIQDIIVGVLNKLCVKTIPIAYQRYRDERSFERARKGTLDKEIDKIIESTSEENTSNGNVDGNKIQSFRALISNYVCSNYSDRKAIPKVYRDKHMKELYIHDKQYFALPFWNCCNADWQNMFEYGFDLGTTHITKPKSLKTAVDILTQVSSHISSNSFGGTTFPALVSGLTQYAKMSLNKYREMAENYVIEEKREEYAWQMLKKEIRDSAQSLEYEIQTLMTSRGETPFLTLGIDMIDINQDDETIRIQKTITKAILKQRLAGLTNGVTPVFPKLVFELKKGNNLDKQDPFYDLFKLSAKVSAFRQYPDYTMTDRLIKVTGSNKPPMGCRSFLGLFLDENGNPKNSGRFNFSVVSINLTRLAIKSKGDEIKFFELLQEELENCKDLTMIRYNILKNVKAKQAPILYMSGAIARLNAEDKIELLLNNGYSSASIGYVGLHNCLVSLYGEGLENQNIDIVNKGAKIMQYIRDFCDNEKQKTGIGFSMYSTPAETLATKFCKQDIKDFGIISGVNDKGYYENSFHYPSNHLISPFEKLDLESNLNYISSGGAISFVELGNMTQNPEAMEDIIRYAYDKTHFLGISTISDKCLKCGYTGEVKTKQNSNSEFECPNCKNDDKLTLSVVRKLCGYLTSLFERPTAEGKMQEIKNRIDNKGSNVL